MKLATGWDIPRVLDAIRDKKRIEIAQFLTERYDGRFFDPIALLEREAIRDIPWVKGESDPKKEIRPYGFAIMSLACQVIETLESYRRGIPTTSERDFEKMKKLECPGWPRLLECNKQEVPGTRKAFHCFFLNHAHAFPDVDGGEFYDNVRNSLLHQSQTRNGWVINVHHPDEALSKTHEVYDKGEKILYRDSFVGQLRCCFTTFVEHLRRHSDNDDVWEKPERKIWWIARLSDQECVAKWLKAQDQSKNKGN